MQHIKLVVVGDGGAGKSSLLISYTTGAMSQDYVPTVFDNYSTNILHRNHQYHLSLWDTAGQEDYDRLRPLSYVQTDVFLVCYNVMRKASLENVKQRWAPEVNHYCPDTPIILCGCQIDREAENKAEAVTPAEVAQVAKDINAAASVRASALTGTGVREAFLAAVEAAAQQRPVLKSGKWSLFRRSSTSNGSQAADHKPAERQPPPLPPSKRAPWIYPENNNISADWAKLMESKQGADVVFAVGGQTFLAHSLLLSAASPLWRSLLLEGQPPYRLKDGTLCDRAAVSAGKLPGVAAVRALNEAYPAGAASPLGAIAPAGPVAAHDVPLDQEELPLDEGAAIASVVAAIAVTLSPDVTPECFRLVLEFLYTGGLTMAPGQHNQLLLDLMGAAINFDMPFLQNYCLNIQNNDAELNPSIGTYLSDTTASVLKQLYFIQPFRSDVMFSVGDVVFPAHRHLLSCRCDVMAAMLNGHFVESGDLPIVIQETSSECFKAILEYLYTAHVTLSDETVTGVLILANRFGITRLVTLCELYLSKVVERATQDDIVKAKIDLVQILLLAQAHNAPQLATFCLHFFSQNFLPMRQRADFALLTGDNLRYVEENQYPPLEYMRQVDEFLAAAGKSGKVVVDSKGQATVEITDGSKGRRGCSVM